MSNQQQRLMMDRDDSSILKHYRHDGRYPRVLTYQVARAKTAVVK